MKSALIDQVARFQAKWQLGFITPEAVPDLATAMLQAGLEVPSVAVLAGLMKPSRDDVDPLVRRLAADVGLAGMTDNQARWLLVRAGANALAAGTLAPREGADQLAYLCRELEMPELLCYFVYLSADYDPEDCAWFDARIRETAAEVATALGSLPEGEQPGT